jgi:hypothetical protein
MVGPSWLLVESPTCGLQIEDLGFPVSDPLFHDVFLIPDVCSGVDEVYTSLIPTRTAGVLPGASTCAVEQLALEGLLFGVGADQLDIVHPRVAEVVLVLAPLKSSFSDEVGVELDLTAVWRWPTIVVIVVVWATCENAIERGRESALPQVVVLSVLSKRLVHPRRAWRFPERCRNMEPFQARRERCRAAAPFYLKGGLLVANLVAGPGPSNIRELVATGLIIAMHAWLHYYSCMSSQLWSGHEHPNHPQPTR